MNRLYLILTLQFIMSCCFAQHSDENSRLIKLHHYEDTLTMLGKQMINNETDVERINANYEFIKTLVTALKVPNSFLYKFDSVKSVRIENSPDNRFRIISWHIVNDDGSYRFYGTVQVNTGGQLQMYPLNDYSPMLKHPEDSVTSNVKWYGAQYYKIIPVYSPKLYYVLLGWKGNNEKSTKKVIDVLSMVNEKPQFGLPVFEEHGKTLDRVVFEYTRQASMLLKYEPDQNLIVFDHLSPPDAKQKNDPQSYGPDLSYDGFKLKNGKWVLVENLDMRNIPQNGDAEMVDPKKKAIEDRNSVGTKH